MFLAALVGHERRMDAAHDEMSAKTRPGGKINKQKFRSPR